MGKGIDLARTAGAGLHADVLDDFKDQLLIVLLKRLAVNSEVSIPVAEVDDTGGDLVSFNVIDRVFNFQLRKKS
jgi:hypothetical protein